MLSIGLRPQHHCFFGLLPPSVAPVEPAVQPPELKFLWRMTPHYGTLSFQEPLRPPGMTRWQGTRRPTGKGRKKSESRVWPEAAGQSAGRPNGQTAAYFPKTIKPARSGLLA